MVRYAGADLVGPSAPGCPVSLVFRCADCGLIHRQVSRPAPMVSDLDREVAAARASLRITLESLRG